MLGIRVFDHGPTKIYNVLSYCGQIVIDDFTENVFMPVEYWSLDEYKAQWKDGIERIKQGHEKSCLITKIYDPREYKFVELWSLYRRGDNVHIFNCLFVNEVYEEIIGQKEYSSKTCYDFISDYCPYTEDGTKVSEWIIPVDQIDKYLPDEKGCGCSCQLLDFDPQEYGDQVFHKKNANIIFNEFGQEEDDFWFKFSKRRRVGIFSMNFQNKGGK